MNIIDKLIIYLMHIFIAYELNISKNDSIVLFTIHQSDTSFA